MFFDIRRIQNIPNFIDQKLADTLLKHAKSAPKKLATVGKIINGKYTTDYHEWCTADFVDFAQFELEVKDLIPTISNLIQSKYNVNCVGEPEIHFLSYKSGSYYKSHIDGQYIEEGIAKRGVDRDITAVYYLNDDFTGGEVFFDYFNLNIKPKQNNILMYPTTFEYQHSVSEVQGERYAIVFWFKTDPQINVEKVVPKR